MRFKLFAITALLLLPAIAIISYHTDFAPVFALGSGGAHEHAAGDLSKPSVPSFLANQTTAGPTTHQPVTVAQAAPAQPVGGTQAIASEGDSESVKNRLLLALAHLVSEQAKELKERAAAGLSRSEVLNLIGRQSDSDVNHTSRSIRSSLEKIDGSTITNSTFQGANVVSDALTVTGNATLATADITTLSVLGDAAVTGNLTVSGAQTLSGALGASYLSATDAAATSTLAGSLNVGSGALYVDAATGQIGLGTTELHQNARLTLNSGNGGSSIYMVREGRDPWEIKHTALGSRGLAILNPNFGDQSSQDTHRLYLSEAGGMGIGTPSPGATALLLRSSGSTPLDLSSLQNQENTTLLINTRTNHDDAWVQMALNPGGGSGNYIRLIGLGGADGGFKLSIGSTDVLNALKNGNVGIGTPTPSAQLHTTGTVRFAGFGAGTLTTDASGNLSVSSDERLKTNIGSFSRGLADIRGLSPISFSWRHSSGLDTEHTYYGFSAQNVRDAIPEAVGIDPNGYLTLSDRPILAASVNAIKELDLKIEDITTGLPEVEGTFIERITAWFEDHVLTVLGLKAKRVETDDLDSERVRTNELCLDGLCINRSELEQLLDSRQGPNVLAPVSEPDPSNPEADPAPDADEPEQEDPEDDETPPATDPEDQAPTDDPAPYEPVDPAFEPEESDTAATTPAGQIGPSDAARGN